ncbi:MAG: hypothetical protein J6P58_01125, partial [Oscillospiraceae bacterium]|nr:hypothetical protein [Oscillospiraceae bacterium]
MKTNVRTGFHRWLALLLAALLPVSALSVRASAADSIVVDTSLDTADTQEGLTTLRDAVSKAGNGTVITFADSLSDSTITLDSPIT